MKQVPYSRATNRQVVSVAGSEQWAWVGTTAYCQAMCSAIHMCAGFSRGAEYAASAVALCSGFGLETAAESQYSSSHSTWMKSVGAAQWRTIDRQAGVVFSRAQQRKAFYLGLVDPTSFHEFRLVVTAARIHPRSRLACNLDIDCSGHGICRANVCVCHSAFSGIRCQRPPKFARIAVSKRWLFQSVAGPGVQCTDPSRPEPFYAAAQAPPVASCANSGCNQLGQRCVSDTALPKICCAINTQSCTQASGGCWLVGQNCPSGEVVVGQMSRLACELTCGERGLLPDFSDQKAARIFDSSTGGIQIAGYRAPVANVARTMCAWFRTSQAGPQTLVSTGSVGHRFNMRITSGGRPALNNNEPNQGEVLNDDRWHHLCIAYQGPSLVVDLHVDGHTYSSQTLAAPVDTKGQQNFLGTSNDGTEAFIGPGGCAIGYTRTYCLPCSAVIAFHRCHPPFTIRCLHLIPLVDVATFRPAQRAPNVEFLCGCADAASLLWLSIR